MLIRSVSILQARLQNLSWTHHLVSLPATNKRLTVPPQSSQLGVAEMNSSGTSSDFRVFLLTNALPISNLQEYGSKAWGSYAWRSQDLLSHVV